MFLGENPEKIGFIGFIGITQKIGFIGTQTWAQINCYFMIGTHESES